ncbi:Sec39 domain-containing protein [Dendryphion nanum]|uniref:Sec39 domain-containing protein n=1 Tax=Dendryphion nanum TaxID=256645 RepID=A0A9P9EDN9_9PLEO|nr:Sec39 domain-containing protein [Dendryphion nanum]
MAALDTLSGPHCVLLAAKYAAESNIAALRALTALKARDLELGLVLRILLTFLPESLEPSQYVEYLHELSTDPEASRLEASTPDLSSVENISNSQARKRSHKLHTSLQPLPHPLYEGENDVDAFTHFLIHRSHRIDAETGQLDLVPQLVVPFLHHSDYLRTWFISTALPLLRLGYEYYPQVPATPLDGFARLYGRKAIGYQLSNIRQMRQDGIDLRDASRDIRGVVGPWICGSNDRKRRKLDVEQRKASISGSQEQEPDDWECLFEWLVQHAKEDFPLIAAAFTEWDGPSDLDYGGFDEGHDFIGEEKQGQLERRYAQAVFASLYLINNNSSESLQTAHALLIRLANLLGLDPPADLSSGVNSLPVYNLTSPMLEDTTTTILQDENILRLDNIITQPDENSFRLLELFTFSACLLSSLQYPISIRDVARMYIRNDHNEQNSLLQKILHSIVSGSKNDADQWRSTRSKLLWLWDWGINRTDGDRYGQGIFGKLKRKSIETEILKALIESGHYPLAAQTYIQSPDGQLPLDPREVETVILLSAMHHYDNASNGNRTRGGMKRASDIVAAFKPYFPDSSKFHRTQALLAATHAMSFYSLILQHGVPFQPVNIRVSSDPLSLLRKLLSQNRGSYTKLDDLISIGQNLVISMASTLLDEDDIAPPLNQMSMEKKRKTAERRVIGMAIEAALEEDDFESAYSYVVTKLRPSTPSPLVSPALSTASQRFYFPPIEPAKDEDEVDDVAWRAALEAGRHGSAPMSTSASWSGSASRPDLRRLEQRMELLSQALILAPPARLEEVLTVWQQCEQELTQSLADEADAEEKFNDRADRRLPGAFDEPIVVQPRREVGRGAVEESPMGLFDVARGAAAAFSKTAFPLRANSGASRTEPKNTAPPQSRVSLDLPSDSESIGTSEDRVRKRDMVTSAVTGGLASGIGWVLGAKPLERDRE